MPKVKRNRYSILHVAAASEGNSFHTCKIWIILNVQKGAGPGPTTAPRRPSRKGLLISVSAAAGALTAAKITNHKEKHRTQLHHTPQVVKFRFLPPNGDDRGGISVPSVDRAACGGGVRPRRRQTWRALKQEMIRTTW